MEKVEKEVNELSQETQVAKTAISYLDPTSMNRLAKNAQALSRSDLLPEMYKGKWENVMIAMDIASRMNMGLIMVTQNLYIVKGKPAWSGSFCAAAINGCGKFTPLEYVFVEDGGGGCFARATRIATGAVCVSDTITMKMAKDEGWTDKSGSKWKTMPKQMMMYRAASFFARAHCPEVLLGIQTVEEVQDVKGYEQEKEQVVTVVLE